MVLATTAFPIKHTYVGASPDSNKTGTVIDHFGTSEGTMQHVTTCKILRKLEATLRYGENVDHYPVQQQQHCGSSSPC